MPASQSAFPPEFIKAIPKTDLHLHLDGSLRSGKIANDFPDETD